MGHEAVVVFFVLSGYCIASSILSRQARGAWALSEYLLDRVGRLWTVLLPALAVTVAVDALGIALTDAALYRGIQGTAVIMVDVAARASPLVALGNAAFLQTLLVPTFGSNGALWSLANEFWYYVWFPPLLMLLGRLRRTGLAILAALVTAACFTALLPGFAIWLLGAGVCAARTRLPRFGSVALAAVLAAFAAALVGVRVLHPGLGSDAVVAGAFALLLAVLVGAPSSTSIASHAGRASSYSIYAVHLPLLVLATALLAPAHRLPYGAEAVGTWALCSAAAVLAGLLFSTVTERHTARVQGLLQRLRG